MHLPSFLRSMSEFQTDSSRGETFISHKGRRVQVVAVKFINIPQK